MITVKKLELISETPNTYGFISLGMFNCEGIETFLTFSSKFMGSCTLGEKEFDILVFKVGFNHSYIVLADLNTIPAELIIDESEIKEKIKEKVIEELSVEKEQYKLFTNKDTMLFTGYPSYIDSTLTTTINYNDTSVNTNANYTTYTSNGLSLSTF